jgi:hypothetical protein
MYMLSSRYEVQAASGSNGAEAQANVGALFQAVGRSDFGIRASGYYPGPESAQEVIIRFGTVELLEDCPIRLVSGALVEYDNQAKN